MALTNKIAVFDIDGTFFRWQLYHELVFALKEQGVFSTKTAADIEKAIFEWKALRATWNDYEMTVVKAAESELNSIDQKYLIEVAKHTVEKHGHRVYSYTLNLSKKLKDDGYYLLAISGSHQEIVELFAKKYGFDDCIGMLQKRDKSGHYTGEYERPVYGHKAEILKNYLIEHPELSLENSYGVGDSGGDIDLLQLVENPIAFNPTQELLKAAQQNNWQVVIERKNIAYVLIPMGGNYQLKNYEVY